MSGCMRRLSLSWAPRMEAVFFDRPLLLQSSAVLCREGQPIRRAVYPICSLTAPRLARRPLVHRAMAHARLRGGSLHEEDFGSQTKGAHWRPYSPHVDKIRLFPSLDPYVDVRERDGCVGTVLETMSCPPAILACSLRRGGSQVPTEPRKQYPGRVRESASSACVNIVRAIPWDMVISTRVTIAMLVTMIHPAWNERPDQVCQLLSHHWASICSLPAIMG